jgi:VIT1/CCC1 family predicted Fe2+/Mn2+ transporter
MGDDSDNKTGRDETEEERLDRKWNDLLQELRVMQTGAQLTAGFLLTLPFQQTFAGLDHFQKGVYLFLVLVAGLTTATVMAPVAVHRRLSGEHVKERVVNTAHRLVHGVLLGVSLLISGMALLIFDVVVDRTWAIVVAVALAAYLISVLVILPSRLSNESF